MTFDSTTIESFKGRSIRLSYMETFQAVYPTQF